MQQVTRELKEGQVEVGMEVNVVGKDNFDQETTYIIGSLYNDNDTGFKTICGKPFGSGNWELGRVRVLLLEDVQKEQKTTNKPVQGNPKYDKVIHGKYDTGSCTVDVYRVLEAFSVTSPQLQHLVKKALNAGQRGHKDTRQDLVDILDSAQSALDMYDDILK